MESAFGKICIFAAHPGNPARRSLPSGASPSSQNSGFYFSFYVRPERNENLVLIALAHMLGAHFFSVSLFVEQSYCFSRTRRYFYTQLVSRGKVERLFYLNLYSSLSTISHSHLLRKMELTVNDKSILELVSSFLALRIFDENGGDWSSSVGVGIPPAGLITDVLVNFLLDDFDREFIRSFPGGSYARFLYKSFLSFPPSVSFDGEEIESFLYELGLSGEQVVLEPGDAPIPCCAGFLWINREGVINFMEKG